MKTLFNKAAATLSRAALFGIGCVMAGIGMFMVMILAIFGLAVLGLSILAAPFTRAARNDLVKKMAA